MLQRVFDLAAVAAGTVVGAVSGVAELASAAASGVASTAPGRVHLAVRGVHDADAGTALRVEQLLEAHGAVHRAEVNAVLGYVMVEFDPDRLSTSEVAGLVRAAERECGLAAEPHAHRDHPGAPARALREAALLGLSAAGLAYTTVGRAVPAAPVALPSSLLALIDTAPRLRAVVDAAVGEPVADSLLGSAAAVANTLGRRPVALLVDACQRYTLHQEAQARRRAWATWERALAGQDGAHRASPRPAHPRPAPIPAGPVEKVADRAAAIALAGAAALFVATRATPPVSAALTVGVPKAAQSGREGFAAQLGRHAAARGSLVLDRAALRRLDRVDTIVLDAEILRTGRHAVDEVVPLGEQAGRELSELVERAHDLVDLRRPQRRRAHGGWSLEPVGRAHAGAGAEGRRRAGPPDVHGAHPASRQ